MIVSSPHKKLITQRFLDEDDRWWAIMNRNADADGAFVYAVTTTGVYCRPTCPARRALRENIAFYPTCQDAESAGFRPCKRCRPTEKAPQEQYADIVTRACRSIEEAEEAPSLDELAASVGMSRYYFHRLFKARTGVTPKKYAAAHRANQVRRELIERKTVTEAIYGAGFNSSSRFYESSNKTLGMTPKIFRKGGVGISIHFAVAQSWLGTVLVAATERGICAILLGDDSDQLVRDLYGRFPNAHFVDVDTTYEHLIAHVVGFLESPSKGLDLPLDIQGTAFQQRVWDALRKIPAGTTVTYSDIAKRIGKPDSVRAVANACGANPLAVAIPCHRVIRSDSSESGYRWGVERKRALLKREKPH